MSGKISTIPTKQEIADLERLLEQKKKLLEKSRSATFTQYKSVIESIPNVLPMEDVLSLFKLFENKLRLGKKNPRGTRIPPEVRAQLEDALRQEKYTLADLEKMFGFSISYIAKVKNELGLTRPHGAHAGANA